MALAPECGCTLACAAPKICLVRLNERGGHSVWNPLTDDGDALRLAVKLQLLIDLDDSSCYVAGEEPSLREQYGSDPYAATRRAIVRAAAAMGDVQ